MGSIGGVNCTFIHGTPTGRIQRVFPWQVPGINGYGVQIGGLGNSEFKIEAVYIGARLGIAAWCNSIMALIGQPITIVNDLGISYANAVIVRVEQPTITAAGTPTAPTMVRVSFPIEGIVA